MASKFVTLLEDAGKDLEKGIAKVIPIAEEAEPILSALDPALGGVFTTVVGIVTQTEQKFAALGQQSGTGTAKLADALAIASPVVTQAFAAAGKPSDGTTVTNYINSVVNLLNNIPASAPQPTPVVSGKG